MKRSLVMRTNHSYRDPAPVGRDSSPRPSPAVRLKRVRVDFLSPAARERVLCRYETIGSTARWHRLRFDLKQLVWWAVVRSTSMVKRTIDIAGSLVLLVVLSPVLLMIALLVKLNSPGPVFYEQTRVMKWGHLFQMYKFRSMYKDADRRGGDLRAHNEMEGGVTFKMKADPRITGVGRLLRRGSIDELPQLWNVLKGEMSLVGPRPPLPSEVAQYSLAERRRLDVTPGITCTWQVSGRSEIPFDQQVELDVAYIDSQSLRGDLLLLLKTIPAVLMARGAY
jgi:lipopolysaccharide/colanic/teichoic acid biosynthesis glycosyltransferase